MNLENSTLADHLRELKKRALLVFGVFLVFSLIGFVIHVPIEKVLQKPLGETLYYTNPVGGLAFVMQISIGFGIVASLPLAIFQILQFIRPTIKPIQTKKLVVFAIFSALLSIVGLIYVYYLSLPGALRFLVGFNSEQVKALINASDYMRFIIAYAIGAIITFQLPLLLFFANKIRRFPPGSIGRTQRPVIAGVVIVSGIITPTVDPINQLIVAVPMLLLYESGALIVAVYNHKENRRIAANIAHQAAYPVVINSSPKVVEIPEPVLKPIIDVHPEKPVTPPVYTRQPSPVRNAFAGVHMDIVNQRRLVRSHA